MSVFEVIGQVCAVCAYVLGAGMLGFFCLLVVISDDNYRP